MNERKRITVIVSVAFFGLFIILFGISTVLSNIVYYDLNIYLKSLLLIVFVIMPTILFKYNNYKRKKNNLPPVRLPFNYNVILIIRCAMVLIITTNIAEYFYGDNIIFYIFGGFAILYILYTLFSLYRNHFKFIQNKYEDIIKTDSFKRKYPNIDVEVLLDNFYNKLLEFFNAYTNKDEDKISSLLYTNLVKTDGKQIAIDNKDTPILGYIKFLIFSYGEFKINSMAPDSIVNYYLNQINMMNGLNQTNIIDNIKKNSVDIINYIDNNHIDVYFNINCLDYIIDEKGNVIKGSKEESINKKIVVSFINLDDSWFINTMYEKEI